MFAKLKNKAKLQLKRRELHTHCTLGPNVKNPPKMRFKRFVKLTNHTYAYNDFTYCLEYVVYEMTGNGSYLNWQKLVWKNS